MRVRWIGVALALAVVGGAAGYWLGADERPEPVTFSAAPVPASSPSYPVIPVVVVPDSTYPALEPGVPVHRVTVGASPFEVSLPIPRGWVRSDSTPGEWKWYPSWDQIANVHFVRLRLVGNSYTTIPASVRQRIAALEDASDVADLDIEVQRPDRFVADYVADQHRRVAFEGYLGQAGSSTAYASIAVVGRSADRAGLRDLFERLMDGTRI